MFFICTGTANIVNYKRQYQMNEVQYDDEERFRVYLKLLFKLKEL